jgi:hypothetical protein
VVGVSSAVVVTHASPTIHQLSENKRIGGANARKTPGLTQHAFLAVFLAALIQSFDHSPSDWCCHLVGQRHF